MGQRGARSGHRQSERKVSPPTANGGQNTTQEADGLMKTGAKNPITGLLPPSPGRWLPHEDWRKANEQSDDYK